MFITFHFGIPKIVTELLLQNSLQLILTLFFCSLLLILYRFFGCRSALSPNSQGQELFDPAFLSVNSNVNGVFRVKRYRKSSNLKFQESSSIPTSLDVGGMHNLINPCFSTIFTRKYKFFV